MNDKIDKSIIQEIRDILNLKEECSPSELYTLLVNYRNHLHPDKFIEESAKNTAEEKFKEAGKLLTELFKIIEIEKLNRNSTELTLFKPVYEQVYLLRELEVLKERNHELEDNISSFKYQVDTLNEKLDEQTEKKYIEHTKYLESLYKPSLREWTSITILFLLTIASEAMSKIEEVSLFIKRYSPLNETFINLILFIVFVLLIISTIKLYFESKIVKRKVKEMNSSKYAIDFMDYLKNKYPLEDERTIKFIENDAYNFICGNDTRIKRFFSLIGFKVYQIDTIDLLKNCFIDNLLRKKLIEISNAKLLDRTFSIKWF